MMLESEEADMMRLGEPPPVFVAGGELAMRPSNMGIQSAASIEMDLASTNETVHDTLEGAAPPGIDDGSAPPPSRLRRINEKGGAVPGSQDSALAAQAQQQLGISDTASVRAAGPGTRRSRQQMSNESTVLLRCAMCGPGPGAYQGSDSRGLMQHLCRSHLGHELSAEAVAQLRALDKVACRICAKIRARTTPTRTQCGVATSTRALRLGDQIHDTRRGNQSESRSEHLDATAPPLPQTAQDVNGAGAPSTDTQYSDAAPQVRHVMVSQRARELFCGLSRRTLDHMPAAVASKYADAWAESLEGMIAGVAPWGELAKYRSRLILAPTSEGMDRNEEVKRRMRLWEEDRFEELAERVQGQQTPTVGGSRHSAGDDAFDSEESKGKRARAKTALNQGSKAMQGLVGGIANADASTREQWCKALIPRSGRGDVACSTADEIRRARELAWGGGDFARANTAMKEAGRQRNGQASLPHVRIAPMCATGPSGERQGHLDDIVKFAGVRQRRRLFRALDDLTDGQMGHWRAAERVQMATKHASHVLAEGARATVQAFR